MVHAEKITGGTIAGLLAAFLLTLALTACGTATDRTDNADEFRSKVTETGFDVALLPEREGRPDLVEGEVTSEDGISSRFSFAFGPAPERVLPAPADGGEAVWFPAGDELHYWMDYTETDSATRKQRNHYYDAVFAVEDTACQIVADQDCGS